MARIKCNITEILKESPIKIKEKIIGKEKLPHIHVVCNNCGTVIEKIGTEDSVIQKCLKEMRDICPNQNETNDYIEGTHIELSTQKVTTSEAMRGDGT